mmetsp:Transcript_58341/g.162599  ORF Transcript_58341/g.162599 Transcript_58341/m.162599 type:complete len:233 (+) Transcript_58341:55-753(+)
MPIPPLMAPTLATRRDSQARRAPRRAREGRATRVRAEFIGTSRSLRSTTRSAGRDKKSTSQTLLTCEVRRLRPTARAALLRRTTSSTVLARARMLAQRRGAWWQRTRWSTGRKAPTQRGRLPTPRRRRACQVPYPTPVAAPETRTSTLWRWRAAWTTGSAVAGTSDVQARARRPLRAATASSTTRTSNARSRAAAAPRARVPVPRRAGIIRTGMLMDTSARAKTGAFLCQRT